MGRVFINAGRAAAMATTNAARASANAIATAGRATLHSASGGASRISSLFSRGGGVGTRAASQSFEVLGSRASLNTIRASPQATAVVRNSVFQSLKRIAAEYKKTIISSTISAVVFSGISIGIQSAISSGGSEMQQLSDQVQNNTELLSQLVNNGTELVSSISNNNTLLLAQVGAENARGLNDVLNNNTFYLEDAIKKNGLSSDELSDIYDQAFEEGIAELENYLGPEFVDLGYLKFDELKMFIKNQIDRDFLKNLLTRLKAKEEQEKQLEEELAERKDDLTSTPIMLERLDAAVIVVKEEKKMLESLIATNIDEDIKHRIVWREKEKEIKYRLAKEIEKKTIEMEAEKRKKSIDKELEDRFKIAEKKEMEKRRIVGDRVERNQEREEATFSKEYIDSNGQVWIRYFSKSNPNEMISNLTYYNDFHPSFNKNLSNSNKTKSNMEMVTEEKREQNDEEYNYEDVTEEDKDDKEIDDYESYADEDSQFYCVENENGTPICQFLPVENVSTKMVGKFSIWMVIMVCHLHLFNTIKL